MESATWQKVPLGEVGYSARRWVVLGEDGGTHQRVDFVLARC